MTRTTPQLMRIAFVLAAITPGPSNANEVKQLQEILRKSVPANALNVAKRVLAKELVRPKRSAITFDTFYTGFKSPGNKGTRRDVTIFPTFGMEFKIIDFFKHTIKRRGFYSNPIDGAVREDVRYFKPPKRGWRGSLTPFAREFARNEEVRLVTLRDADGKVIKRWGESTRLVKMTVPRQVMRGGEKVTITHERRVFQVPLHIKSR